MEENHKKALIVAFYLSKFDRDAYINLNFGNMTDTHKKIGQVLKVNPNTIKNMRDQFDSVLGNNRKGWWQKPLSKTRLQTIQKFNNLSEISLFEIVTDLLNTDNNPNVEEIKEVLDTIDENNENIKSKRNYTYSIARCQTGLDAENYFINNFEKIAQSIELENSTYIDTRTFGCGYDFELVSNNIRKYIEVKGISGEQGNILFTDKEWNTALIHKENYILILVKNLNNTPSTKIIINPAEKYQPTHIMQQIVQINWLIKNL